MNSNLTNALSAQKLSVLDYCNNHSINPLKFIEDTMNGKSPWCEHALDSILDKAITGDTLIVAEVSRLGRSTLQVLEILEVAAQKDLSMHIAKNRMIMDGLMQATIIATILGLAAQIEREFISVRTKEALAKSKKDGIKLGRPKGEISLLKLDAVHDEIISYIKKKINKRNIAKLIECSPLTLYKWLKRRHIRIK